MIDKYGTLINIIKTLEGHKLNVMFSDKTLEYICDRLCIEPVRKDD